MFIYFTDGTALWGKPTNVAPEFAEVEHLTVWSWRARENWR